MQARTPGSRLEDPAETQAWADRYLAGEAVASIARSTPFSDQVVRRRLRAAGVQVSPRPNDHPSRWSPAALETVLARYEAGERTAEIAQDEGVSATRLRYLLAKAGTPVSASLKAHRQARRALAPKPSRVPRPRRSRPVVEPDRAALIGALPLCGHDLGLEPGDRLTAEAYAEWAKSQPAPSLATLRRYLGTWSRVVALAGYAPGQQPRRSYTRLAREEAVRAVGRYLAHCQKAGERPTGRGYRAWSRGKDVPSESGMLLYWRWSELVAAAEDLASASNH